MDFFLLLTVVLLFASSISASSVLVELGSGTEHSTLGHINFTDLIAARGENEAAIWQQALNIFERVSTTSCGTMAATRLFKVCKTLSNNTLNEEVPEKQTEQVKSLYGIRMSICETGRGGAKVPFACKGTMMVPIHSTGSDITATSDLAILGSLTSCIGALQKESFRWTSYSNNLRDASSLCEAGRIDIEMQEKYEKYNEMLGNLFDINGILIEQNIRSKHLMDQAESRASEIHLAHTEGILNLTTMYETQTVDMTNNLKNLRGDAADVSSAISIIKENANHILHDFTEQMGRIRHQIAVFKDNLTRDYDEVSEELTTNFRSQVDSFEASRALIFEVFDLLESDILALFREDMTTTISMWQEQSQELIRTQHQLIQTAYEQRNLTDETLLHQLSARDLSKETVRRLQETAQHIERLAQPIRSVSKIYDAYKDGKLATAVNEFVFLGLTALLMGGFMLSFHPIYSLYVAFSYVTIQFLRFSISHLNLTHRIRVMYRIFTDYIVGRPYIFALTFTIPIVLFGILWALRDRLRRTKQCKITLGEKGQHDLISIRSGRDYQHHIRGDRASTAPPGL